MTWAPYEIQVALNGREWLKRLLDKSGAKYLAYGNKFLDIENYELAGQLLDSQLDTKWVDKNSIKFYNEQNVLRFEFTMNDPTKFRVHRTVTGNGNDEKKFLPMRKGVADIAVRTKVCSSRIKNFTEQIAALEETATVESLLSKVALPVKSKGKRQDKSASSFA